MRKFVGRKSRKSGLAPGTMVHIGTRTTGKIKIRGMDYNGTYFKEVVTSNVAEVLPMRETRAATWINVDGIHDISLIERLGKHYGLHPLVLEDIVSTSQRPKVEYFGKYIYFVLKLLHYDDSSAEVFAEQVSLVLGKNFVLSFQETEGDVFDPIRARIRSMKADYLLYSIIDAVVDNYFVILEKIGERIENLEEDIVENPSQSTLRQLHRLKREIIYITKSVWPLREAISTLQRTESELVRPETNVFLRDVYDHAVQVIDTAETLRDILAGMLEIYLSGISNKMNEIMKVLTVISTVFIPLSFVASLYGMNFVHMPELDMWWAYPAVILVMLAMAFTMLLYFKRKGWIFTKSYKQKEP